MEKTSQRDIRAIDPTWTLAEIITRLAKALAGDGPAIALSSISSNRVSSEIALVVSTSGSTSIAKEVGLSPDAILASAKATNKYLGAVPGQIWSLLLPLTHIAAVNVIIRSKELGTTPIDLRDCDGEYPKANYTAIVPTQLFRALNGDQRLLNHLKSTEAVLVGGAALSQTLCNQAESAGIKVITTYGMTETCGGCVYDGVALEGIEIEIRQGKICIKGPVLASSIPIIDGWFETSDLGEFNNDQLVVIGRSDDVIISGGENLSLNAVENSLSLAFPDTQFAAFAVEDSQWGQSLQVAVVGTVSDDQITAHLEKDLGYFAKPKGIHRMSSLPLLGIGKIDRKTLAKGIANE